MSGPGLGDDRQRWSVLRDAWRTKLWPLPAVGILVALGLGVMLPALDAAVDGRLSSPVSAFLFSGGPDAARTLLSVISGSIITVTSLTFSLTVVTLQLASSQFSPRLLRTFTRDRLVHGTLALLLATFTYAVTVLRTVRTSLEAQAAFVPQISVTVAYVLGLVSVLGLVVFLAHLARQIRVESMLREVQEEAAETVRRLLPHPPQPAPPLPQPPAGAVPLSASTSGFFTSVDETALVDAAVDADAVILLDRCPGESLIAGVPIATAWRLDGPGPLTPPQVDALSRRVGAATRTGFERTTAQDVAFGLRQLVDVAVKALSPGVNDPTTAVHALGHISAVLCEAVGRDLGPKVLRDTEGTIRVILARPDLPMLLELGLAQPRRYGAADPEVMARLLTLLREVAWSSRTPAHTECIGAQLRRTRTAITNQDLDPEERVRLDGIADTVSAALTQRWPTATLPAHTGRSP
ncbi:hypothetical protein Acor_28820 [Acrocarpospora corrugata]|uniref:DUF2254 domain-containing protein n=1 Tax=Acrocarpospora corrugata TaxID=35763 RepID=A0A5M3W2J5_9ACTN|nr:DUF2254 domain-containing protein [Acrocarpospora corrugata]GES00818.1 hypothetical protein Acor_28820 [Acrocarpospora corrugata]